MAVEASTDSERVPDPNTSVTAAPTPTLSRGFIQRLLDTWEVFIRALPWIAPITLIVWLPANYTLNSVLEKFGGDPNDLSTMSGGLPLFTLQELLVDPLWMSLVLSVVLARMSPVPLERRQHWFVHAIRRWPTMWGVILVTRPIMAFGALLILPGLLFLVRYVFVEYSVAWEGNSVGGSLKRSWRLAATFSGKIFWHALVIWGLTFLAASASYSLIFYALDDSYGWASALSDSWFNLCWAFPLIYFGLLFLDLAHAVDPETFETWPAPLGTAPRPRPEDEFAPVWMVQNDLAVDHVPKPRRPRWVVPTFAVASLALFLGIIVGVIGVVVLASLPESYHLGADYFEMEDYEAAIPPLRRADRESDDPDIDRMLGVSLYWTDRYSEAIPPLEEALESYPDDEYLRCILGVSLCESNQITEAVSHFAFSHKAVPNDPDYAWWYLASLHDTDQGATMLLVVDDLSPSLKQRGQFQLYRVLALRKNGQQNEACESARSLRDGGNIIDDDREVLGRVLYECETKPLEMMRLRLLDDDP